MNEKFEIPRELLERTLLYSEIPSLPAPRRGKVRDVYDLGDRLLMVTSDRVSAFDVVLGTIPIKGQVLTAVTAWWFEQTRRVVANHIIAQPDPAALLVKKLRPLPVEVVVRRYITGSLYQAYQKGERDIYGLNLPPGLHADQRFEKPVFTFTTKGEAGEHDLPLRPEEVVERGLVPEKYFNELQQKALALFDLGERLAAQRGLILVDTKYEFGLDGDKLLVMDEIHTPDSSRYWEADSYAELFRQGKPQRMLDKENLRQWLRQRGFSGEGQPPPLDDQVRLELASTYARLQLRLTGGWPQLDTSPAGQRLLENLKRSGII